MLALLRCLPFLSRFLTLWPSFLLAFACFSAPRPQTAPEPPSSVDELTFRAEAGDAAAKHQLAEFLISADPVAPGYDLAVSWLQFMASRNVVEAQFLLGYLCEHGKGVRRDFAKAAENYSASAHQGYAPAENNLGALYQHGNGVPQDLALAFRWYRLAAIHGNASAQSSLGTFYYLGYGTAVNYPEAVKWFRTSADQGFAPAQANLAFLYVRGLAAPANYKLAARWARLAADQGHPRALALLGYLSEHGKGLPLDYVSAYAWYSRAIGAGEESSSERLKNLSQIMTRKQLDQANSLLSDQSVSPQQASTPADPTGLSLLPTP